MPGTRGKRFRRTATILIAVISAGCLSFFVSHRSEIKTLRENAEYRLNAIDAAIFAPTDKFSYLPEVVANHPIVIETLLSRRDPRSIHRANIFLQRLNANAKSAVVYILDENGVAIASSNWQEPQSFVGRDYAFRPYFIDAMHSGTAKFYAMGVTTLLPGYYISQVIKKDGAVLGVAVVKIDLNNLDAGWAGSKEEVAVTDENGIVFLSSRQDWKYRPMQALAAPTMEQLKRTRQYEAVLKEPMPIVSTEALRPDERIVSLAENRRNGHGAEQTRYFVKSRNIAESKWTINVLAPMTESDAKSGWTAIIASGSVAFAALFFMYMQLVRKRNQEAEKSRLALEQKHFELQTLSEELRVISITDPLTGAYNRRFFMDSAAKIVSAANRHQLPLSVVMIDVDHFKRINDKYGHPAGDKVLQMLVAASKETLREEDVFARFGGEEFIVILPNTDAQVGQAVAERLRAKVMDQPIIVNDELLYVTVSCGVSEHRQNEPTIEDAIKRADEALYAAKGGGRNQLALR
jgi:two-component system C4-dicarboxylate transport sensor histidine kinase DctB